MQTYDETISLVKSLVRRVLDYDVQQSVTIDSENNICINKVPIGNVQEAHDFSVTDEGFLRFNYGNHCKRIVNFGYRGYEKRNRVKEIIELGNGTAARIVWSEERIAS